MQFLIAQKIDYLKIDLIHAETIGWLLHMCINIAAAQTILQAGGSILNPQNQ